jgi:predicted XRE-type DNA-binding protein
MMKVTRSSGNVFDDLGFGRQEAENLRIRAALMMEIDKYIRRTGLTQTAAAKRFGVSQPRISDLMRGRIDVFSIDTLVNMLAYIGKKVDLKIRPVKAA